MSEPIQPAVQQILELFSTQFAALKFGDLDGHVLEQAAARVAAQFEAVAHAEAELEAARGVLAEGQEALLVKAQRALAHARIFSEEDHELSARLDAIILPRSAPAGSPARRLMSEPSAGHSHDAPIARRRARAREATAASPPLFHAPNGSTTPHSAQTHTPPFEPGPNLSPDLA